MTTQKYHLLDRSANKVVFTGNLKMVFAMYRAYWSNGLTSLEILTEEVK